uniref:Vomeronasal type-1 receptor n=1 Tax=Ursus americanus TaxID=9643 RepID=A0A452SMQ6_URSAM
MFTHVLPVLIYSWISSVLINTWVILSTPATSNSTDLGLAYSLLFCKTRPFTHHYAMLFQSVMFMQDIFFLFFMIWTSFYMVIVLFGHHETAMHIHSPSLSPQSLPKTKATHAVLLLGSCVVFFYGTNLSLSIHMSSVYERNLMLENITSFLSSCYPAVCALVLTKYDNRVSRSICAISNRVISPCSQWRLLLHLKNTDKNYFRGYLCFYCQAVPRGMDVPQFV